MPSLSVGWKNSRKTFRSASIDSATEKKYINQHNSGWFIQGELTMSLEYGLNGKAKSKPVEENPLV